MDLKEKEEDELILKARNKSFEDVLDHHKELVDKIKKNLPQLLIQTMLQIKKDHDYHDRKHVKISYKGKFENADLLVLNEYIQSLPDAILPAIWTSDERKEYTWYDLEYTNDFLSVSVIQTTF